MVMRPARCRTQPGDITSPPPDSRLRRRCPSRPGYRRQRRSGRPGPTWAPDRQFTDEIAVAFVRHRLPVCRSRRTGSAARGTRLHQVMAGRSASAGSSVHEAAEEIPLQLDVELKVVGVQTVDVTRSERGCRQYDRAVEAGPFHADFTRRSPALLRSDGWLRFPDGVPDRLGRHQEVRRCGLGPRRRSSCSR